jgi:NIMA-interacting peptidyl-prolyl cis-trans isomerase 1
VPAAGPRRRPRRPRRPPPHRPLQRIRRARCLAIADVKREKNPNEPAKIGAKHVLVKFAGAKRADASVTRTREQACLRAMQARDELRNGADWAKVVEKYSDESGAASRQGSIGSIERKDVAPPFAEAAFELGIGEFSDVVESEYGFHVIQRSE